MLELMKKRYTTKHYDPSRRVSDEDFDELLEVARLSPSAVNAQPWHFFNIDSQQAREKLAGVVADFNQARLTPNSRFILFTVRTEFTPEYFEELLQSELACGRITKEEISQAVDAGRRAFCTMNSKTPEMTYCWNRAQVYIALGFVLAAAAEKGIDSTVIEGFDMAKADEVFGLREKGLRSAVLLSLGYRAPDDSNAVRPKARLSREAVVTTL